jgi:HEAT repeat protein
MYSRAFFKACAEKFPELVQWGVASNDPIVLRKVLSLGEEIDSNVAHDRALELVKSNNQRLVNEGIHALGQFKRPEDAELLIALLDDEKLANQAVGALDNFEPLHVEQFARLLDHPNVQVRHNAYMALRELPGGKDLKFNTNATGDEIAQEKQKIIDWLKEKGHLKGDD